MARSLVAALAVADALNIAHVSTRRAAPRMALSGEDELLARFGLPTQELKTDRRSALGLIAGAAVCAPLLNAMPAYAEDGMFSLPPLPYAYDAVRPARVRRTAPPRASSDCCAPARS
jgi:hypothetical protein